jgi:membrane protein implicated in regulation of membrane protease activity
MKRYGVTFLIIIISTIGFIAVYRLTDSWKLSLVIAVIPVVYLIMTIGEFIESIKSSKEQAEKEFRNIKDKHIEETKDNPTLR